MDEEQMENARRKLIEKNRAKQEAQKARQAAKAKDQAAQQTKSPFIS